MNELISKLAEIGWLHQTDNNEIRLTKEIPTREIILQGWRDARFRIGFPADRRNQSRHGKGSGDR